MTNLLSAFTLQGNLDADLWYTTLFNEVACKYLLCIEDESKQLEPNEINFDKCKDLFPDVLVTRQYSEEYVDDPDEEITDIEIPNTTLISMDNLLSDNGTCSLYIITKHKRLFLITATKCTVLYSEEDNLQEIKKFVNELWERFPKAKAEDRIARVGLIKFSNGEYYTSFSDIRKTTVNIEENYNDDFIPVYNDVVDFLNQRESGLVLLYGIPGSGKSTMIRHLCSNVPRDYVIVPNSVAPRLGDPDFISYVTSCKDYVFILEDCEQLLMDRSDNPWNNAITTILNMADGLLSDIVNIKFICTFNAEVDKIDPALLRKGRCFAKYEFKELCEEKVKNLNDKYNLGVKEIKPMTLAEIYNAEKTDYSEDEKKPKKIGF